MRARGSAAAALAALLLAGCGGSAEVGEAGKSAAAIVEDAGTALQKADAVRVSGTGSSGGRQIAFDLRLRGADAVGTVTENGQTAEVTVVGGKTYIRGAAAFWAARGAEQQAAAAAANRWLLIPANLSTPLPVVSVDALGQSLIRLGFGSAVSDKVRTESLDGARVLVVTTLDGGRVDIAANGVPYPLRIQLKGSQSASMTLSDFGTIVPIAAPADALDISRASG